MGAEDITFAHCRFEARTSVHKKHVHEHAEEVIYIPRPGAERCGRHRGGDGPGDTHVVPRGAVHWFSNP